MFSWKFPTAVVDPIEVQERSMSLLRQWWRYLIVGYFTAFLLDLALDYYGVWWWIRLPFIIVFALLGYAFFWLDLNCLKDEIDPDDEEGKILESYANRSSFLGVFLITCSVVFLLFGGGIVTAVIGIVTGGLILSIGGQFYDLID